MLTDKSFRRTAQCGMYAQLIKQKDCAPLITPFDIQTIAGRSLTEESINEEGMEVPVVIQCSEDSRRSLGLKLPPADTTLSDIADTLGRDFPVKVIEVGTQHEIEGFTIGEYADYLERRSDMHKLLNMISLEISATSLSTAVLSPRVLIGLLSEGQDVISPKCKSMFSRVWGEAIQIFMSILEEPASDSTFFPETLSSLGECKKVSISAGDTLLIPAGWIHAVFTPVDSLVIGGNFLLSASIVPQLQVYSVEHRTKVSAKYRFPFFKQLVWYVLCRNLPPEMERQGMATSASSEDDDDNDDDDDDDDLLSDLRFSRVAWSWPYLVKAAQVWVAEDLSEIDRKVFEESAQQCLQKIKLYPPELFGSVSNCGQEDETPQDGGGAMEVILGAWWKLMNRCPPENANKSKYLQHVDKLMTCPCSAKSFDVLDEELFELFPFVNKATSFYAANDSAQPCSAVAIKLEENESNVVKTEKSHQSSFVKGIKTEDTSHSHKPEYLSLPRGQQQTNEIFGTTTTNAGSRAARSFGTRGKRLSAEFLKHAADVDITDEAAGANMLEQGSPKRRKGMEDFHVEMLESECRSISDDDDHDHDHDHVNDETDHKMKSASSRPVVAKRVPTVSGHKSTASSKVRGAASKGASSLLKQRLKKKFSR